MSLELRLVPGETVGETVAWFLPGDDPHGWIVEAIRLGGVARGQRLLLIPKGPADPTPLGALLLTGPGIRPAPGPSQPWVVRGDRLFHPAGATLVPPAEDSEIQSRLAYPLAAWHPAVGLVGYGEEDVLTWADLLVPLRMGDATFDQAVPGVLPAERLLTILPVETPDVDSVLEGSREDIGRDSLRGLSPLPGEPRWGFGSRFRRGLARLVLWGTHRVPTRASEPTWINRLEAWAGRHLAESGPEINALRDKELYRLMRLMTEDPDRALRHALPLSDLGSRGRARAGTRLGSRRVDFSLRALGGGRKADGWMLSNLTEQRLRAGYRELANREIRLGRHRRAAYVFAHLLGDFRSAAHVLRDGGWMREAAVLFEKRLNAPLDAAACLECGGFLAEAARLYESHHEWEKAARLQRSLGLEAEAQRLFREAVERHVAAGRPVEASRILAIDLDVPGEALALLATQWPNGNEPRRCLQVMFELFGRMGDHERARRLLASVGAERALSHGVAAASVLAGVAQSYPEARMRSLAADRVRVLAGNHLARAGSTEVDALLQAIRSLAPEDAILRRDTQRFGERNRPARNPRGRAARDVTGRPVRGRMVREIPLPEHFQALAAGSNDERIVIAGFDRATQERSIVDYEWSGDLLQQPLGMNHSPGGAEVNEGAPATFFVTWCEESLVLQWNRHFPQPHHSSSRPVGAVARAIHQSGIHWDICAESGGWALSASGAPGELLRTHSVPSSGFPIPGGTLPLLATVREDVVVILGSRVFRLAPKGWEDPIELEHSAHALLASARHSRKRLFVGHEQGVTVIDLDPCTPTLWTIAPDLERPVLGRDSSERLVVAGSREIRWYRLQGERFELLGTFELSGVRPIAITRGPGAGEVVLVERDRLRIVGA